MLKCNVVLVLLLICSSLLGQTTTTTTPEPTTTTPEPTTTTATTTSEPPPPPAPTPPPEPTTTTPEPTTTTATTTSEPSPPPAPTPPPEPTTTTPEPTTTTPEPTTTTATTTSEPPPPPAPTPPPEPTTTTPEPTTTTATTTSETPPPPAPTPPPEPTTTTPEPTTTTPEPTTTTATTTSEPPPPPAPTPPPEPTTTTPEPTTTTATTTSEPPPPPAPTPPPPPQQGNWSYTDHNVTCIILQFTARLNVTYTIKDKNNSTTLSNASLNIPTNAMVIEGSCNSAVQWVKLSWPDKTWKNNVTLEFHSKPAGQSYSLTRINITLTADEHYFPNSSSHQLYLTQNSDQWTTPFKSAYRCLKQTEIKLTGLGWREEVGTISLSQLQAQAFRTGAGHEFGAARDCASAGLSQGAVAAIVICTLGSLAAFGTFLYLKGYVTIPSCTGH